MCGIAGIYKLNNHTIPSDIQAVKQMMNVQIHRGPDDSGLYQDHHIILGHRRLAIIDLSPAGRQPMSNEDGTVWITYNGEIYNFQELREALAQRGHTFRSQTDTEVLVHGYEEWGIEGLFSRLRGMFAFALYDSRLTGTRLIIARDRLGIKPLYYSYFDHTFIFASELKAILSSGIIQKEIEPNSIGLFLLNGSIPSPYTAYKRISSLQPGHFLIIDEQGIRKKRYYNLADAFLDTSLSTISEDEAVERVRSCLVDTIKCHLLADVPVGAFLSGGIDSSSIVALMREVEHKQIKTVSVIFPDTSYDESKYSKVVARRFDTDHLEIELTARDFKEHLEKIFQTMDQPTIDGVNTFFVSWAAVKAGLKVAVSGLGGDEIFGGYPSFTEVPRLYRLISALSLIPFGKDMARFFLRTTMSYHKAKLYSMIHDGSSIPGIYHNYRGLFTREQLQNILQSDIAKEVLDGLEPATRLQDCSKIHDKQNQVSFLETTHYMANQLLRDTDVFSMAHSLEVRVPFVDHILVELLAKLPVKYKLKKDIPKRLLIKALNNLLPEEIFRRPKMGFTFPFDLWMRNELKEFTKERVENSTLFQKPIIKTLLDAFCNGNAHWSRVWGLVVLTEWME